MLFYITVPLKIAFVQSVHNFVKWPLILPYKPETMAKNAMSRSDM
jgi:hypothetical protein